MAMAMAMVMVMVVTVVVAVVVGRRKSARCDANGECSSSGAALRCSGGEDQGLRGRREGEGRRGGGARTSIHVLCLSLCFHCRSGAESSGRQAAAAAAAAIAAGAEAVAIVAAEAAAAAAAEESAAAVAAAAAAEAKRTQRSTLDSRLPLVDHEQRVKDRGLGERRHGAIAVKRPLIPHMHWQFWAVCLLDLSVRIDVHGSARRCPTGLRLPSLRWPMRSPGTRSWRWSWRGYGRMAAAESSDSGCVCGMCSISSDKFFVLAHHTNFHHTRFLLVGEQNSLRCLV